MSLRSTLAALALAVSLAACRHHAADEDPAVPPVHTRCVAATRSTLTESRSIRGTVAAAPEHQAVVSPQVAGRITRVRVREADHVRLGDVVAEIESPALQDALAQARGAEVQARAIAHNAQTTLTRTEFLFGRGIAARQEVDDARSHKEQSDASVTQTHAALETATRNLARAQVRAPLAGVVVRLIRQSGEVVDGTPSTPVLEIADPSVLEFQGAAAPADLVALRAGQTAHVRFDALPDRVIDGTVRAVSPSVALNTGVGGVRFTLDTHDTPLPLGLFGTAEVTIGQRADVTVIPAAALRNGGTTGTEVVVCDNGHAHPREVTVGLRQGDRVEVTDGLTPGLAVAIDGVLALTDGSVIVVVTDADGGAR